MSTWLILLAASGWVGGALLLVHVAVELAAGRPATATSPCQLLAGALLHGEVFFTEALAHADVRQLVARRPCHQAAGCSSAWPRSGGRR